MMQQLQQERAAASNVLADIVQPILDEAVALAVAAPPSSVSFSESPDSPVYCPPEIESEDEEMASVSYECSECQLRGDNIWDIMMHLEEIHGIPDDEEILRMKVREIKTKDVETREMPDTTTVLSVQENNNENI